MADSSHNEMIGENEEIPNTCSALIPVTESSNLPPLSPLKYNSDPPPNFPVAYFFTITLPQPKIRIRIPKIFANAIKRSSDEGTSTNHEAAASKENKRKLAKPRNLFYKNIGCLSSVKSPTSTTPSGFQVSEEIPEVEDDEEKERRFNEKNSGWRSYVIGKKSLKIASSFPSLFNKNKGLKSDDGKNKHSTKVSGSRGNKNSETRVDEEIDDNELCKRKILMGSRCRPLSSE